LSLYKLAVMISGSGSNLQAIMDAADSGFIENAEVALVISNREGAYGLVRAETRSIPNMVIGKDDVSGLLRTLDSYGIDGIVLAGYLSILPPEVVTVYCGKIVNIHPALLPMFGGMGFYGIRVHRAVLASGMPFSGATAHIVDSGVDTGAALVRGVVPVLADDSAESLQLRVLSVEHLVLVEAVKALVEGRVCELVKKPSVIADGCDDAELSKFAKEFAELGRID